MAAKSIIEIDVRDEKFQSFLKSFDTYAKKADDVKKAVEDGSHSAESMAKRTEEAMEAWEKLGESAVKVGEEIENLCRNEEEKAETVQGTVNNYILLNNIVNNINNVTSNTAKTTKDMGKDSEKISHNFRMATISILKWSTVSGVFSGLLGAGGLYGLTALGAAAGASRRSASGLGVSSGQQQAFGLNFGRFVNSDSLLQNTADSRTDYNRRVSFDQLGIQGVDDKDTGQLAVDVTRAAKRLWDTGDHSAQSMEANGLGNFMSMDDWRRIGGSSNKELEDQAAKYSKDAAALKVDDPVLKEWQDFTDQIHRAGTNIETTFIKGLVPLAPELGTLSEAVTGLVKEGLASPLVKEGVAWLAKGIHELGSYMKDGRLQEDFEKASKGLSSFMSSLDNGVKWLKHFLPGMDDSSSPSSSGVMSGLDPYDNPNKDKWHWDPLKGFVVDAPGAELPLMYDTPTHLARRAGKSLGMSQSGIDSQGRSPGEPGYDQYSDPGSDLVKNWAKNAKNATPAETSRMEAEEASRRGVPASFARSIFAIEGGVNTDGTPRISPMGAIGPGQLMPKTAAGLFGGKGVNPFDTADNVRGSIEYQRELLDSFGDDQDKAAAGYNAGPTFVKGLVSKYGSSWKGHLNDDGRHKETVNYLAKLAALAEQDKKDGTPEKPMQVPQYGLGAPSKQQGAKTIRTEIVISNPAGANVATSTNQLARGY